MTVAAAIEIGTGGAATPGLGKALGGASNAGLAGAGESRLPLAAPGAESFRAGLQSLLASLGGFSGSEANNGVASAGSAPDEANAKRTVGNSKLAAGADLGLLQRIATVSKETGAAKLTAAENQANIVVARSAAGVARLTSTKMEAKKPETEAASASDSTPAHSIQAAQPEAVAALPGEVPAEIASLAPVAAPPLPVACVPEEKTESTHTPLAQTALAVDLPTAAASPTLPTQSDQLTPDFSGRNGQRRNTAESTHAREGGLHSTGKLTEGRNAVESAALALDPNRQPASSMNSAQTLAKAKEEPSIQSENPAGMAIPAAIHPDGGSPARASDDASQANGSEFDPSFTATTAVSQSGSAGSGKGAAASNQKSTRSAGNIDSVTSGRALAGQNTASAADAAALARDLAGERRGAGTAGESARAATAGPDSRETFATLDSGSGLGRPTWVHAGGERAEAGYQDPTLGWVSVRADATGGGVRAELVAGSTDAAHALGSHMAGLNAYLAEHHTPVDSLTLTSSGGGWPGSSSDTGAGRHGAGQQSGQGMEQSTDAGGAGGSFTEHAAQPAAALPLAPMRAGLDGSAQPAGRGGVHISVMA